MDFISWFLEKGWKEARETKEKGKERGKAGKRERVRNRKGKSPFIDNL